MSNNKGYFIVFFHLKFLSLLLPRYLDFRRALLSGIRSYFSFRKMETGPLALSPLAFRSLPFAHPREPVRGDEAISGNLFHLKRNDVPLALAKLNPDKPDLFALALILLPVALLF